MLIQVYPALRWSDTFRVLASVERPKTVNAVWACGVVKDRECGSVVWSG